MGFDDAVARRQLAVADLTVERLVDVAHCSLADQIGRVALGVIGHDPAAQLAAVEHEVADLAAGVHGARRLISPRVLDPIIQQALAGNNDVRSARKLRRRLLHTEV